MQNIFLDSMKVVENSIDNTEHKFPELQFLNVWEEHTSLVVLMMKGRRAALERFMDEFDGITKNVFRKYNREVPHSIGLGADIDDMQEVFQKCRKALTFCLVKGCDRLIRADEIHSFGMREESYPIREEKKIFSAIESWDIGEAKKWIDAFLKKVAIEDGNPEDVRHNILKLMGSMVGMAKEINLAAYRLIIERNYICRICALCTISEAREILYEIAEEVNRRKEENEVSNYIVNRTLEYVQNHFKEDVSLKKLAEVLEITPEYLSMLFKRETGMNFSIYLKEFRINYAKRLIKGTDMKVYEVARECGYSNSNYFTKVFKEVTGISPTKYH